MLTGEHRFTVCIERSTVDELDSLVPQGVRTELIRATIRMLTRTLHHNPQFLFVITGAQLDETRILSLGTIESERRRTFVPDKRHKKRQNRTKADPGSEEGEEDR
jgi:hypothetical protein